MNAGIKFNIAKHIRTEFIRTLSAIGSQILPKDETQLFLRAIKPSKKSLKQAKINNKPASN